MSTPTDDYPIEDQVRDYLNDLLGLRRNELENDGEPPLFPRWQTVEEELELLDYIDTYVDIEITVHKTRFKLTDFPTIAHLLTDDAEILIDVRGNHDVLYILVDRGAGINNGRYVSWVVNEKNMLVHSGIYADFLEDAWRLLEYRTGLSALRKEHPACTS